MPLLKKLGPVFVAYVPHIPTPADPDFVVVIDEVAHAAAHVQVLVFSSDKVKPHNVLRPDGHLFPPDGVMYTPLCEQLEVIGFNVYNTDDYPAIQYRPTAGFGTITFIACLVMYQEALLPPAW